MLRFICFAVFLFFLRPGFCQEPRKDPFLAPDDEIRAMTPRNWGIIAQVSVQLDWIRLPHLTANQLIRQHLKHTAEGAALYNAVQELIAQKKAERLNFMTVPVRGGQRSKGESIVELPYPTEFDPAMVNQRTLLSGEKVGDQAIPATPSSYASKNTGHTCEVEAIVSDDRTTIDLNLAPEWIQHLATVTWGEGLSRIQQPVFGTNKGTSNLLLKTGEWQMAGLFTPPHGAPEGKLHGSVDVLPGERVFLFVRGSMDAPARPVPGAAPPPRNQVTVLAEWVEVETATVADLLAKSSDVSNATAMREALEPMILDGRASLLESSAMQVRGGTRSKIESITEMAYPTEFDPPQGGGTFGPTPPPPPKPEPSPRITPPTFQAFATKNTGTTMEVEASIERNNTTIDLNLAPELIFNLGRTSHGQGISRQEQAKFQVLRTTTQLLTRPNIPAMIGTFDAPMRNGEQQTAVRKRKVLLFVRAIL